ncbi:glycoprotein-N-acetylgalactosamine 3-beta-galactosyltransferase 1-like [Neocloeon triangulifer]|uniref:glycoprotein-N-acetylgalactosamine 3-beta-galactosyltransferase 1-like n=1 Tax=Neocloeon triangulifer TaxID=2078957 RepID=UPI00286F2CF2|nr:glycoprotein-N-acetylgalactosamine 3-beta-galactosyltransferase 1-like [Neocloeon triangulifer]
MKKCRPTESLNRQICAQVFATGFVLGMVYCTYSTYYLSQYESFGEIFKSKWFKSYDQTLIQRLLKTKMPGKDVIIEKFFEEHASMMTKVVADQMRILCWVCTSNNTHKSKAMHVKATWSRRCDKVIFVSETEDDELPTLKIEAPNGREGLWVKTVNAFKYVHENFINDYDWFFKADDDAYVVIENMRKMLLPYNPDEPAYFGYHFKQLVLNGYMAGGGGYVLSRHTLKRLVTEAFVGNRTNCPLTPPGMPIEDFFIGTCLQDIGINPSDSRDFKGHFRFFPTNIDRYVSTDLSDQDWFYRLLYWPYKEKSDCCSKAPISFHYMTPDRFYMMEYLVYNLNIFSVTDLERV